MKLLRTTALAATVAASSFVATPERVQAQSYQIDCAILLCLSGGWPASVPCTRARAEFIRRITPWPIEPPLQIWRCPMGVSFNVDPSELNQMRLYDIFMDDKGLTSNQSFPSTPPAGYELQPQPAILRQTSGVAKALPEGFALQFVSGDYSDENGTSDINISSPEFDFVRSIQVFSIEYARQIRSDNEEGTCRRYQKVRKGTYGEQGDFHWSNASISDLPEAHTGLEAYGRNCPTINHRSVFVDWRDYQGNYGFEQVNY